MLITQDTKQKTSNLELGGGLESGDGRDDAIRIEEEEEERPVKTKVNLAPRFYMGYDGVEAQFLILLPQLNTD